MAKRKSKKLVKNAGIALGIFSVLLLVFLLFYFGIQQAQISTGVNIPPETFEEVWDGKGVTINTILGSYTSSSFGYEICGDSDGKITISNSYETNYILGLHSSMSTSRRGCGTNYITAEIEFPKGILKGNCKISAKETDTDGSRAKCSISRLNYNKEVCDQKDPVYHDGVYPSEGCLNNVPASIDDYFEFNIGEPMTIEVELTTRVGQSGSSKADMSLEFIEEELIPELIMVYRLEITRDACWQLEIFSGDRISDDYDTLEECEAQMTIPPEPEPKKIDWLSIVMVSVIVFLILLFFIAMYLLRRTWF